MNATYSRYLICLESARLVLGLEPEPFDALIHSGTLDSVLKDDQVFIPRQALIDFMASNAA